MKMLLSPTQWMIATTALLISVQAEAYSVRTLCLYSTDAIYNGPTSSSCSEIMPEDQFDEPREVTAEAAVDLATGVLKTTGKSNSYSHTGIAVASFVDTVTVNGSWEGTIPVEVTFRVTGSVSGAANQSGGGFDVASFTLDIIPSSSNSFKKSSVAGLLWDGTSITTIFAGLGNHSETVNSSNPSSLDFLLSVTYDVPATNPSFDVGAKLASSPIPIVDETTVEANFANTGVIAIHLPDGFSFDSASTVLLTNPVPIPAPLLLLGSALTVLRFFRRSTQQRSYKSHDSNRYGLRHRRVRI